MIPNSLRIGVFLVPLAFCYAEGAAASPLTVCYSVTAPCTGSVIRLDDFVVAVIDTRPSIATLGSDYAASNFGDNAMSLRASGENAVASFVDRFLIEGGVGSGLMSIYPALTTVPEPMTLLLVGSGVVSLGTQRWWRRRRRN